MARGVFLLIIILSLAALSGCIAYEDSSADPDTQGTDAENTGTNPPSGPYDGPMSIDAIYSESWAGQTALDDVVSIGEDYDYLTMSFGHAGQIVGRPTFTTGTGERMDQGLVAGRSGAMTLARTLPGDAGTGSFAFEGAGSGAGSVSIQGIHNFPPAALFSLGWSGQAQEVPLLGGMIAFYVPVGLDKIHISLSASGQAAPGISIVNADGDEVANTGIVSGPHGSSSEAEPVPGVWSVYVEGPANGAFGISVSAAPDFDA